MKTAIIGLLVLQAFTAYAFPEMGRLGYSSCQSCHVSPSGGGVLNKYGRTIASEVLGTWSYEGAGEVLYGLYEMPEALDVGGDVRVLRYQVDSPTFQTDRTFLMQADLELALHLSKQISVVGLAGVYGKSLPIDPFIEYTPEFRRYYMILKPQRWLTLRAGKFFPAYGLMLADHTVNVRKMLWPQGSESQNLEAGIFTRYGELIATVATEPESPPAYLGRAVGYFGKYLSLGLSGYTSENEIAGGAHAVLGIKKIVWLMAEYNALNRSEVITHHMFGLFGVEAFRGGIAALKYELTTGQDTPMTSYGFGLQWFPFPHYEISLDTKAMGDSISYAFMGHYFF